MGKKCRSTISSVLRQSNNGAVVKHIQVGMNDKEVIQIVRNWRK